MKYSTSRSQSDIELHRVLDEIADLISSGSQVDVESYVAAIPKHAEQVRDFVASMQLLADFGDADSISQPKTSRMLEDVVPTSRVLGDFRVLGELGRGGMGIVYEAEQISLERIVALKILPFAAILDDRQLQRFKNEARAAATLHHPHIVPVFSVGSERGVHYYAMQKIEGATLAELLADVRGEPSLEGTTGTSTHVPTPSGEAKQSELRHRSSQQPSNSSRETRRQLMGDLSTKRSKSPHDYFRTIAHWGRETAEALAYAHENGVLHRDIKPGNLMIDGAGHVWITDFGLARIESDASMTMSGDIVGTLRYMAPEQVLGNSALIDHRADVYALGVTLYELATRHAAFSGTDRHELIHKITTKELLSPRKIDPSIPADLETIILKAASKAPEDRYTTAKEFAEDLQEFLADRPIKAKPPNVVERALKWSKRHPAFVWSAVIILLVITLFSLGGLTWTRHKNAQLADAVLESQQKTADANEALEREKVALSDAQSASAETSVALDAAREAEAQAKKNLYLSTMRQAYTDLQQGESARFADSMVKFVPQKAEEDLRNWEWHYLLALYQQHERVLLEHVNGVHDLALHPEGRYLATAGVAGTVCMWDSRDWTLESAFRSHGARSVTWHPDGRLLAIANSDDTVRIWDTDTGLIIDEIPEAECFVLEFSPDGNQLAGAIRKQGCKVWNTNGLAERWSREMADAQGVSWSPDGQRIACSGEDKSEGDYSVVILDSSTGKVLGTVPGPTGMPPVRWSPRGDRIAAGLLNEQIQIFDADTFELLHSVEVVAQMEEIQWSNDGQQIAAGIGKNVEIYDERLKRVDTLTGHSGTVLSVVWSADDQSLIAGGTDGATLIWQLQRETNSMGARTICPDLATNDDAASFFSKTGRFIATLSPRDNEVVIRRVTDGMVIKRFDVDLEDTNEAASWGPDDTLLACITNRNRSIVLLNVANGRSEPLFTLDHGEIEDVDCNPIYPQLATSVVDDDGSRGHVEIWDTDATKLICTVISEADPINAVAWDPAGKQLAVVEGDSQRHTLLRIWDVQNKRLLQTLTGHTRFYGKPVWSPENDKIAAFGWDGEISIWNVDEVKQPRKLRGHANAVQGIWHPSGQRMFTCSKDKTLRLWDVDSGEEIFRMESDYGSLFMSADAFSLILAGQRLEIIDVEDEKYSAKTILLAYAANESELDEAHRLLRLLPNDSRERNYVARRLLNRHYWLARGVHAAVDQSSPNHLTKMFALWQELVDETGRRKYPTYGISEDEYFTVILLQCAHAASVRALQHQQDPDEMLAVLDDITRTVEERLGGLSLSVKEKDNIPNIISAVRDGMRRLSDRTPTAAK